MEIMGAMGTTGVGGDTDLATVSFVLSLEVFAGSTLTLFAWGSSLSSLLTPFFAEEKNLAKVTCFFVDIIRNGFFNMQRARDHFV